MPVAGEPGDLASCAVSSLAASMVRLRTVSPVTSSSRRADTARRVALARERLAAVIQGGRAYGFQVAPDTEMYHRTLTVVEAEATCSGPPLRPSWTRAHP